MSRAWFTLAWRDDAVVMLDQRRLPVEETYLELREVEEIALAIEDLVIRGAPAIGCAAAMGIALAAVASSADTSASLVRDLERARERLARTRPTAVNLFWALDRMNRVWTAHASSEIATMRAALIDEAQRIHDEDVQQCRDIGAAALELVPEGSTLLTHCNAGALATAGYGTALGVVRAAHEAGRGIEVLADETRPYLQGARLTAWELQRDGIPVTVITDNMAAHLMQQGRIDLVVVGSDRIAANGDVANKIGTYGLAVLSRAHDIPFYVAAPRTTIDLAAPDGASIPIEERSRDEVAAIGDHTLVPAGVPVRHPAFDVTPAHLVSAIVTEAGILQAPYGPAIAAQMNEAK